MTMKRDLVIPQEIDSCLRKISDNKLAQEQLLKLLQEIQITLDDPTVEDSIDGTRIRLKYVTALSRKKGGVDEAVIKFQYIKEITVDFNTIPISFPDNNMTVPHSVDDTFSGSQKKNGIEEETIIESYDELEKSIPTLYEVLGHLKSIYFIPEDFSNRLVVDRIHKLRNIFNRNEILAIPSIDPSDKAGLIPI